MVIIMKRGARVEHLDQVLARIEKLGLISHVTYGEETNIIDVVGDRSLIGQESMESMPGIARVVSVQSPFKLVSRMLHPENTIIKVGNVEIGGKTPVIIAGPCSIEGEPALMQIAEIVKNAGANILRGGAFKPRSSPYSFQGFGTKGLKMLRKAGDAFDLPVITEIMDAEDIDDVCEYSDILQVGARNMQNFTLLKKLGLIEKPILLKRGISATIEEWLLSAEYIMSGGNLEVFLCERGIRTFEPYTKNTLDLSAIPVIKELSHLPIIVDPSHATGRWRMVEPMSKAAIAAGADGLEIEVHTSPEDAWSDGAQSLKPDNFAHLVRVVNKIAAIDLE